MKMIKKISIMFGKKGNKLRRASYKLLCFLTLTAILFTYSCKHSNSGKETQQINVTITVKGDKGLINQTPQVFKVKKDSTWKEIEKDIAKNIALKEEKEIKEWRLGDVTGNLLQDSYVFEKDETLFLVTQHIVATYTVEHWQENIEDDLYTRVEGESETKHGKAGDLTQAETKTFLGFSAQNINQQKIKADGSTVIKIYYKRNIVSLIIDLQGGNTASQLKEEDGKTLLKGKIGATVQVQNPTKDGNFFYGWKPELPQTFSIDNDKKEYVAQWEDKMRVYIKGDERLEVSEAYIKITPIEAEKWENIKDRVKTKVSLKAEIPSDDYGVYDWKIDDYDGKKIEDNTKITHNMTVYARTNYTKFKWQGNAGEDKNFIAGCTGSSPTGRIILPANTVRVFRSAFKDCRELTAVDVLECTNLSILTLLNTGITSIDLSKCGELSTLVLSQTGITDIDLSKCKKLSWLDLSHTKIERINLSECTALRLLNLSNTNLTSLDLSKCKELEELYLLASKYLTHIDLSQCTKLQRIWVTRAPIKEINMEQCTKLIVVIFIDCNELKELNLKNCTKLKQLGYADSNNQNSKYPSVSGCLKVEVTLPYSITTVLQDAFGADKSTWCGKVIVPNEHIKNLVKNAGYLESKIEIR